MAYATTTDLNNWLGTDQETPTNAERLLDRASELVDEVVVVAYPVDDAGNPTDAAVTAALRDATCAQVEWWAEVGEEADTAGEIQQVQIGSVQLGFGAGPNRLAPAVVSRRTLRILKTAGLAYRGVSLR